jgi:hypothetical protein
VGILGAPLFMARRDRHADVCRAAVAAGAPTVLELVSRRLISRVVGRPRPFVADPLFRRRNCGFNLCNTSTFATSCAQSCEFGACAGISAAAGG